MLPERDGLPCVQILCFPVLLRDERRGCKDWIIVEQPLLDEQPERERDLIAVFLPQVRELLADLDDAPGRAYLYVASALSRSMMLLIRRYWARSILYRKRSGGGEIWVSVLLSAVLMDRSLVAVFHNRARADCTPPRLQPPDEELSASCLYFSNFAYSRMYLNGNGRTVLCPVRTKSTSIVGRTSLNTSFEPLTATILRRWQALLMENWIAP